ncbi:uL30 family ribosomal protein [Candidatus Woesearchaeota archaeon]|nr:uL30 family ribosomal protein [Candidatus Woesearchaeota archaeon]
MSSEKIAVIRIRGLTGVRHDIDATLKKLRLYKKNYCVVLPKTKDYLGMVNKIKDYATWGEIDEDTYNLLLEKRKEKSAKPNGEQIKKFFRLNSPKKGYGRKGIKVAFGNGGALGYRENKINELIARMV